MCDSGGECSKCLSGLEGLVVKMWEHGVREGMFPKTRRMEGEIDICLNTGRVLASFCTIVQRYSPILDICLIL